MRRDTLHPGEIYQLSYANPVELSSPPPTATPLVPSLSNREMTSQIIYGCLYITMLTLYIYTLQSPFHSSDIIFHLYGYLPPLFYPDSIEREKRENALAPYTGREMNEIHIRK